MNGLVIRARRLELVAATPEIAAAALQDVPLR
jgi:hypothetical protein